MNKQFINAREKLKKLISAACKKYTEEAEDFIQTKINDFLKLH